MSVLRAVRMQHLVLMLCAVALAFTYGLNASRTRSASSAPLFEEAPPPQVGGAAGTAIPALHPSSRVAALMVHVVGAVRHPGVQTLPQGTRVMDAVQGAGGATARADLQAINLAARLQDGQQVIVPRVGAAPVGAATLPAGSTKSLARQAPGRSRSAKKLFAGKLKVNTASLNELLQLPGVGPATASRILAYRSQHGGFHSLEDLHGVKGLGPKKLEKLRDHVLF